MRPHITRATHAFRSGLHGRRPFSSHPAVSSQFKSPPSPPRLPKEDQEIFEKLQRQSTGAFSTPRSQPEGAEEAREQQQQLQSSSPQSTVEGGSSDADRMLEMLKQRAQVAATGDGEELHPNVRRGAAPEFQGDTNPKTGEVGGPKNEPLRWGVAGDWSYNGRVTDF